MAQSRSEPVSLAARDIHLAFGDNAVLRGVDIDVPAGSTAAVIGPSGSGKSTLLRSLNRLYEPDRGDILLDGRSVLHDDPDKLRQRIGMVFQQFNLFPHKSVLDNVTLGPRKLKRLSAEEARELALTQLEKVGLRHKADARPGTLSGGQQQRVAIARALAMAPQVMFFDEATSALDPELVKGILALIAELGLSTTPTHTSGRNLFWLNGRMRSSPSWLPPIPPLAMADAGLSFFVANSFSKSMSLYGERCGALSVVRGSLAPAIIGIAGAQGLTGLYTGPLTNRTMAISPTSSDSLTSIPTKSPRI